MQQQDITAFHHSSVDTKLHNLQDLYGDQGTDTAVIVVVLNLCISNKMIIV